MNNEVLIWVKSIKDKFNIKGNILDLGSLDVNGTTKPIFNDSIYTGIDMRAGKNVDIIGYSYDIKFNNNTFDCVVSTEMLEHDIRPWLSILEIHRVLKPGGITILTARSIGFPKHGYPNDYWRFTADGIKELLIYGNFNAIFAKETKDLGVYAYGFKKI